MSDKRLIQLDPNHMGTGDILTEMTRSYLYTGCPSALVQRVLEGVIKYRAQTDTDGNSVSEEDREVMGILESSLRLLRQQLHDLQLQVYITEDTD